LTKFLNPIEAELEKLSGKITRYRCSRASASFVLSKNDQQAMSIVAIAAAFAGLGGQATSVAGHAHDVEEAADYLEFNINGRTAKGWVWRSPFREGDIVDVAARWQGEHYEIYGISRPADRIIALYPHCSRTRTRHIKNVLKWWLICNTLFFGSLMAWYVYLDGFSLFYKPEFYWMHGIVMAIFMLMFFSLSKKFMPFVNLSEKIFRTLGLPNAQDVDLVQSSKAQRTAEDPPEFGTFYFKY
jgi:hypothetical protein